MLFDTQFQDRNVKAYDLLLAVSAYICVVILV